MRTLIGSLLLFGGVALTACGKNDHDDLTMAESQSVGARVEDQFGEGFGKAFRADPNSDPAEVNENDIVPVSLETEPVPID